MSGEGLNSTRPPSPRKTILPHLRVARIAVARAASFAEQSTARSTPMPPVSRFTSATLSGPKRGPRRRARDRGDLHALRHNVDADDLLRAEFAAERAGGEADGAEAGDEHRMIAVDANFLEAFVDGAESAGYLCAVGVGELVGKGDEIFFFGDHELRHAAVALPAVGAAILLAGAGDHVAAAAIVAHAAAGDVIDDDAVACFEAAAARAGGDDLAARLMASDDALVAFGSLAEMLVVDAANVGAANGGRFHAQQNFSVARLGTGTVRISTVELPGR